MCLLTEESEKDMPLNMEQSEDFLSTGVVDIYHARGIIVGCAGAGKTTLLRRLRGVPLYEHAKIEHTEIVDVHANCFEVIDDTIKGNIFICHKRRFQHVRI